MVVLLPDEPDAVLSVEGVVLAAAPLVELPEEPLVVPAAELAPPGVPVLPMGVCWLLCWPAPVAGSLAAGLGGELWAMAAPLIATAATPASTPLNMDAVIF